MARSIKQFQYSEFILFDLDEGLDETSSVCMISAPKCKLMAVLMSLLQATSNSSASLADKPLNEAVYF
jgi:hypothetical protein